MLFPGILVLALILVLLGIAGGMVLFVRFLTSESDDDSAMRFDPFAPRPASRWIPEFFLRWRHRSRQLTYRRDARGRFRRRDR